MHTPTSSPIKKGTPNPQYPSQMTPMPTDALEGLSDDDSDCTSYSIFGPSDHHARTQSKRRQVKDVNPEAAPSSSRIPSSPSPRANDFATSPLKPQSSYTPDRLASGTSGYPLTPTRSAPDEIQSYVDLIMNSARKSERKLKSSMLQSERRLDKIKSLETKVRQLEEENARLKKQIASSVPPYKP